MFRVSPDLNISRVSVFWSPLTTEALDGVVFVPVQVVGRLLVLVKV